MKSHFSIFLIALVLLFAPLALNAQEKSLAITKIGDIESAPFLRFDFNLKGASCVSCIRRIAKRLQKNKGVLKADISILSPYEGVVIFETKKTTVAKLQSEITSEDKRASAGELQLTALTSVPSIVLPRAKTP